MQRRNHWMIASTVLLAGLAGLAAACDDDDDDPAISCEYELSSSGCNGQGAHDYEYRCDTVEEPREGYTAEDLCQTVRSMTTVCTGSCCVNYGVRDTNPFNGRCEES